MVFVLQSLWRGHLLALFIIVSSILLLTRPSGAGIIRQLLRENVAGEPIVHQKQDWPFDPDASLRRRPQYVALHGDKSRALIERLGLGEDGKSEERRAQYAFRDSIPVPPEQDFRP